MINRLFQLALLPWLILLLLAYRLKLCSFTAASQTLALVPGAPAAWIRYQWYRRTLESCGRNLNVMWMAAFRIPNARVGDNVHVGPFCWLNRVEIGDNVMLGGHITVMSGSHQHGTERLNIPMREQPGQARQVSIGHDVWVGNGAIIMTDVAPGTIVAAGAVVTREFEPYSILAGVPARQIRKR